MKIKFNKRHIMADEIQAAAVDILAATHDGNDLDERDLRLTELAINGKLSPLGVIVFLDLYNRAMQEYCAA